MGKKKGAKRPKTDLGDSWVHANPESDETVEVQRDAPMQAADLVTSVSHGQQQPARRTAATSMQPDPQFIMPSLHSGRLPSEYEARQTSRASPRLDTRLNVSQEPKIDMSRLASNIIAFTLDIFGRVFTMLKAPIALALTIWLVVGVLMVCKNLLYSTVHGALTPICNVPGVSFLGLSICDVSGIDIGRPTNVHFDEVMRSQSRFEDILDKTADGVGLPADMKHSEASMRDLRTLVKHSQLKSRHELELELTGFIETARQAAWDLQRYGSRVGRAADTILSTTRWTRRVLVAIDEEKSSRSGITGFIGNTILGPFQPRRNSETELVEQYLKHMSIVQTSIDSLLTEGIAMLNVLNNLEDRLEVIHDINTRDRVNTQTQQDELLAELWTMLGGNRAKLHKLDAQRKILGQVNHYRKTAFAQVSGTITELKQMDSELQELRERAGAAEVTVDSQPLSVHIESLELGVERLEERRSYQRDVETNNQRAILDRKKVFIGQEGGRDKNLPEIEAR